MRHGARPSFVREFSIGMLVVLFAAGLSWLAHGRLRLSEYLTEVSADAYVSFNPGPLPEALVLIDIDDASYRDYFGEESPLNEGVVQQLASFALANGAAVVGLALDTSHWKTPCQQLEPDQTGAHVRVVCGTFADKARGSLVVSPSRVDAPAVRSETGVVRVHPITTKGALPFSDAIASAYCHRRVDCSWSPLEEGHYIHFVERRCKGCVEAGIPSFRASDLLDPSRASSPPAKLFLEKIVLIGGTARLLGDRHDTPFGSAHGLTIQADLVASRLNGPLAPASWRAMLLFELAIGFVLVLLRSVVKTSARVPWPWPWPLGFLLMALAIAGGVTVSFFIGEALFGSLVVGAGILLHDWLELQVHAATTH